MCQNIKENVRNNDKLVGGVSSNWCEQLRGKTFLWKEKFFTRCLPKLSCPKAEFKSSLSILKILKFCWLFQVTVKFFFNKLDFKLNFQNNDFNFSDLLISTTAFFLLNCHLSSKVYFSLQLAAAVSRRLWISCASYRGGSCFS